MAGISLTNMWVGLFTADFCIITITASVERVVEKLPDCPLHWEGWMRFTKSQDSLVRAGSSHTFPGWGLGSGWWNSVSRQPCSRQSSFLPSAGIRLCLWVSRFWHFLDTHGLFIVFQLSCVFSSYNWSTEPSKMAYSKEVFKKRMLIRWTIIIMQAAILVESTRTWVPQQNTSCCNL